MEQHGMPLPLLNGYYKQATPPKASSYSESLENSLNKNNEYMQNRCRLFHLEYNPADYKCMEHVWTRFIDLGRSELFLGIRSKVFVLPAPGQQDPNQITLIRRYMKFHCWYSGVSRIGSHKTVTNLDKVVEITMRNGTRPPRKFTTLRHEYMNLRTSEELPVFHVVIPWVETASCGPTINCLYLAENPMAKDLSAKIAVCPSAWWWHVFQHRGYSERTARSLMECFKMDAAYVADQSTFDETTGTVTTQFANDDDFLDRMDNELASDDNKYMLDDPPDGGTPSAKSTIEISDTVKASLASALDDPDMDLAANLHASAKSRRTNFSSSTGNSTNRSVNTKQYAITHKSCALALAMEIRKIAQLEHENREMCCHLQELEALCASGPNQRAVPTPALESPPEPPMEESPHPLDVGPEATIQVEVPAVSPTESTPTLSRQDEPIDSSAMDGEE